MAPRRQNQLAIAEVRVSGVGGRERRDGGIEPRLPDVAPRSEEVGPDGELDGFAHEATVPRAQNG